jgi:hypothetical protein
MTEEGKKPFEVKDKRSSTQTPNNSLAPEEDKSPEIPETAKNAERNKGAVPPVNFATFVLSLSSSAAMNLGGYQDPVSGHMPQNLELAKQSIDILAILEEKTRGNLTEEEKKLLETSLYELRMSYVETVKKG